jgi:hypothetical protein
MGPHLLGVSVKVETVASIEDRDWRWFVGLDGEGTGSATPWNGAVLDDDGRGRIVALMRLNIEDPRLVDERVGAGRSISFWRWARTGWCA